MKCISRTMIIVPNIVYSGQLGLLKYLMDWAMSFLKQHLRIDKFNQLCAMMPPFAGIARFKELYRQVEQWSGKKMKALGHVVVQVFMATLFNPLATQSIAFTQALLWVKNFVYFHLMAHIWYHPEATIEYMENYLKGFHHENDLISQFHASKSPKMLSEALKKLLTLKT